MQMIEPIVGVVGEASIQQLLKIGIQIIRQGRGTMRMQLVNLIKVLCREGELLREHLVQDHTHREDVGALIDAIAAGLLG